MGASGTVDFCDSAQGVAGTLIDCFPELGLVIVRTTLPGASPEAPARTCDAPADILSDSSYFLVPWVGEDGAPDFADRHIPLMVAEDGPERALAVLERQRGVRAHLGREGPTAPPNRVRNTLGGAGWDEPPTSWTPPDPDAPPLWL